MNEAIKLAIEKGGYNKVIWDDLYEQPNFQDGDGGYFVNYEKILMDKDFWESLGKALEWKINENLSFNAKPFKYTPIWVLRARDYFDLVLTGGDTEKFWEELLTSTK